MQLRWAWHGNLRAAQQASPAGGDALVELITGWALRNLVAHQRSGGQHKAIVVALLAA